VKKNSLLHATVVLSLALIFSGCSNQAKSGKVENPSVQVAAVETEKDAPGGIIKEKEPEVNQAENKNNSQQEQDNKKENNNKFIIALTFDDGPCSEVTSKILSTFEKHGGKCTFCVVGNKIKGKEELLKKAVQQGHQIIGHSWDHANLSKCSEEKINQELKDTNEEIKRATGITPMMYRPPYGAVSDKLKAISKNLNLALCYWSVDTLDWSHRNADKTYNSIINAESGSIVLCHDIHKPTADAVERAVPELIKKGCELVTVSELLGSNIEPGKIYYNK